jgi:S-adenosylmethionine hydrolase
MGTSLGQLGPPITNPVPLPFPAPEFTPELARGEVIHVDRFGNLVTNIPGEDFSRWLAGARFRLQAGALTLAAFSQTYANAAPREFLALTGSHGYLEIACNQDHAARRLGVGVGLPLEIRKQI